MSRQSIGHKAKCQHLASHNESTEFKYTHELSLIRLFYLGRKKRDRGRSGSENRSGDLHMPKCKKIQNLFFISLVLLSYVLFASLHYVVGSVCTICLTAGEEGRKFRWMSPLELLVFEESHHHARLGKPISLKPALFPCKDDVVFEQMKEEGID